MLAIVSRAGLCFFLCELLHQCTCVIVCNKPGSPSNDLFEFLSVVLGVGVLCSRTVLKCWAYKCVLSNVFNVWCTIVYLSPQKLQFSVCFVRDEANVSVKGEIACEVYPEVFVGCQLLGV